jgi:hypothetical protein
MCDGVTNIMSYLHGCNIPHTQLVGLRVGLLKKISERRGFYRALDYYMIYAATFYTVKSLIKSFITIFRKR